MNKLQLSVVLQAVDKVTAPFRGVIGSVERLTKAAQGSNQELKRLKTLDSEIERLKKLETQTNQTAEALKSASAVLAKELSREMAGEPITRRQAAAMEKARKEVLRLQEAQQKQQAKLEASRAKLVQAGIDTHNLAEETKLLEQRTAAYNKELETQRQKLARIATMNKQLSDVRRAASGVGESFGRVAREAGKLALVGGAAGWFFKSQFVDTAAEFERYRTVLETVEGSAEKAGKSMSWVSNFAATTPYELGEVMDSFVKLRAYGLDPTNGLLRTLGDTASAMGKPVIQAVEAIADAITGENERLKEFGIRAEKSGDEITYTYTDKQGQQREKTVDKNNRKEIQQTLEAIWNEKYADAMAKRSRTWEGMMSNLGDQWTRFKNLVMEAGVFDWMKDKLGGLLATIDRMAASGDLRRIAEEFGGNLKRGMEAAWQIGKALWAVLLGLGRVISWVASVLGGYERLGMLVAALMAGKLLMSVFSLVSAFFTLGKAVLAFEVVSGTSIGAYLASVKLAALGAKLFAAEQWLVNAAVAAFSATPLGATVAIVAALAAGAYLVIKHWEPIKAWFVGFWEYLKDIVGFAMQVLGSPLALLIQGVQAVAGGGASGPAESAAGTATSAALAQPFAVPAPLVPAAPAAAGSVTLNAPITIHAAHGMDTTAIGEEFDRRLRERESRAAAARRGKLYD